ncbi:hypothetical protein D3C86_1045240 [compost metagenome]
MKHIKTFDDIRTLVGQGVERSLAELLCERMGAVQSAFRHAGAAWSAEEYGYFCLVEEGDDVRDMRDVGLNPEDRGLIGAIKEVVLWHPESRCWEAVALYGGDYGMTFFIPDSPWLDPALRAALIVEAVPGEESSSSSKEGMRF